MRIFTVLLPILCLIVGAVSATTISGAEYTFVKPNEKNFVYENTPATVRVKVNIASAEAGDSLALKFYTADLGTSLDVSPTSACFDDANVEVFNFNEGLIAPAAITAAKTCTFSGTITASSLDLEYTKLGLDQDSVYDVTPTFTSASSTFSAGWAYSLVHTGDTNAFTIEGVEIAFAKGDTFVITAPNGAPFGGAGLTCDSEGTPLFSVSAQGSRLLFVARDAIATPFTCTVDVVAGPTAIHQASFVFAAPLHGITRRIAGFVSALNQADYRMRIGFLGSVSSPTAAHALYLSVPATSVRAGSLVKFHFDEIENIDFSSCRYGNGAAAGEVKVVIDKQELANSEYSAIVNLASPVSVNANKQVELICDAKLTRDHDFELEVSAVSVAEGFFAASPFSLGDSSLETLELFASGVQTSVVSYNQDRNVFSLNATRSANDNVYIYADIRLDGATFVDVADVFTKCNFLQGEVDAPVSWTPPVDLITVSSGTVSFKVSDATFVSIQRFYIACEFATYSGNALAVVDNALGKVIAHDTVHDGELTMIFGDGKQTHSMAGDAINGGYAVPFTFTATKVYSQAGLESSTGVNIVVDSYDVAITAPENDKYALSCVLTEVESRSKVEDYSNNNVVYSWSHNVFNIKSGYDAQCTGYAKLTPFSGTVDATKNTVSLFMNRCVSPLTVSFHHRFRLLCLFLVLYHLPASISSHFNLLSLFTVAMIFASLRSRSTTKALCASPRSSPRSSSPSSLRATSSSTPPLPSPSATLS